MKSFFLGLAFLSMGAARASNYYFSSSTGDDNRTAIEAQNPNTPWQTLEKFNNYRLFKPGDSIFFKRNDVFYGQMKISNSGTSNLPIYFGSYGKGKLPTISGFYSPADWTEYAENIYFIPLNVSMLNIVTVNDTVTAPGRYPNNQYLSYESHKSNTSITDHELKNAINWTGAEVVLKKYRWVIDRHTIVQHSGNTIYYDAKGNYGNNQAYDPWDGNGYFIQNHLKTLDQDGEWFYDSQKNRFYIYSSNNRPEKAKIKIGVFDYNVDVNYNSNLEFKDLSFEGANQHGVFLAHTSNISLTNCHTENQGGSSIYGISVQNIKVSGGSVKNSNSNGLYFEYDAHNCTVEELEVTNTNLIPGTARSGDGAGIGIAITGNNNTIRKTKVYNSGYNGIQFIGNNNVVEYNYVNRFCLIKDDGGGIYTYETAPTINTNNVIRSNIVLNAIGSFEGAEGNFWEPYGKAAGIYLDGYSNNITVEKNTVAHGEWAGILVNNNFNFNISDNTVYNTAMQLYIVAYDAQIKNVNWKRNKFLAKTSDQTTLYLENYTKSSISSFAQADSNIYARPIHDDSSITIHNRITKSEINEFSVKDWSSKNQFDLNSKQSPLRFNDTPIDAIIFETNPSNIAREIKFQGLYTTLKGELIHSSTTIPPFGSIILLPTKDLKTLPIKFVHTDGLQEKNGILLNWTIEGYEEFNNFSVDWSEDGKFFSEKSQIKNSKNLIPRSSFKFFDSSPKPGMNYYRIRAMKGIDTIAASHILKINFTSGLSKFKVYPNPVLNQQINIQLDNIAKGPYYLSIYATNGILLHKQIIIHSGGLLLTSFQNVSILKPGSYIVQLIGENDSKKWEQTFLKL